MSGGEMENRVLYAKDLRARFGIPRSTLYEWLRKGEGPPAHKRFGRTIFFAHEVIEWHENLPKFKSAAKGAI